MENPQVNEGESLTMHSNNHDSAGVTDQREEDDDGDDNDVSERAGHPSLLSRRRICGMSAAGRRQHEKAGL